MGIAVPVVGAAVGVASTVSQISAQRKQQKAQQAAADANARAISQNTEARMMELEQQKLYREQQEILNQQARLQQRSIQDQQFKMQLQENNLARQEALLNQQLQDQQAISGRQVGLSQNMAKLRQEQISQGLGYMTNQTGAALNQFTGANQITQSDISGRFNIEQQYGNAVRGLNNQQIQLDEATNQELRALAYQYQDANKRQKQAIRQRAANLVGLMSGGTSDAKTALVSDMDMQMVNDSIELALRTGRTRDLIKQSKAYKEQVLQMERASLDRGREFNLDQLTGQTGVAAQELRTKTDLANMTNEISNDLSNLTMNQQFQIQDMIQNRDFLMTLDLNDYRTQQQLGQMNIDKAGLDVLRKAQLNTRDIEDKQSELNMDFMRLGAAGQAQSILAQEQQGLAQVRASRSQTQSPNYFGAAQSLLGAGATIYGALNSGGTGRTNPLPTAQYNPYGQSSFLSSSQPVNYGNTSTTTSFSSPQVVGNSPTGSGILSSGTWSN